MSETPLWWLSFVDPDKSDPPEKQHSGGGGFLGVVIVEAEDEMSAVQRAWELKINPGGQVGILGPIEPDVYGPIVRNRLLTAAEAQAL